MKALRSSLAVVLLAVGGSLAAGGPAGLYNIAQVAWANSAVVLLLTAILLLIVNLIPRGLVAGPLLFAAAAIVVWAVQTRAWSSTDRWVVVGGVAVLIGGALSVRLAQVWNEGERYVRLNALLLPRSAAVAVDSTCPERVTLRAIAGKAHVDLAQGKVPVGNYVEVMVTSGFGRVELVTPNDWPVVTGRVAAASRVKFTGQVDSPRAFLDPTAPDDRKELVELRKKHANDAGRETVGAIIVHVAGFGGEVILERA